MQYVQHVGGLVPWYRHPPLLSRSQETLEVCLSQGSSYESHTGGLDSRNSCGSAEVLARKL